MNQIYRNGTKYCWLLAASAGLITDYVAAADKAAAPDSKQSAAGYRVQIYTPPSYTRETFFGTMERGPVEGPAIQFLTLATHGKRIDTPVVERLDATTWQKVSNRRDKFLQFYYANTAAKVPSSDERVACYTGRPEQVIGALFNNADAANSMASIDALTFTMTTSGRMVGIGFNLTKDVLGSLAKGQHFFRMQHCLRAGRGSVTNGNENLIDVSLVKTPKGRVPASHFEPEFLAQSGEGRTPAAAGGVSAVEAGFVPNDGLSDSDSQRAAKLGLPTFRLKADFPEAGSEYLKRDYDRRPWKGMNLHDALDSERFTLVMLSYFYRAMVRDENRPDHNFIPSAQSDKDSSYWCHMPWLNQSPEKKREAVHGLTKERDLEAGGIYPTAVKGNPTLGGSNWGVGFYNAPGCSTIGQVFGTKEGNRSQKPNFNAGRNFAEGTVSIKTLFTTADVQKISGNTDEKRAPFRWWGNVSYTDKDPANDADPNNLNDGKRRLRQVNMVQIDISLKDKEVAGMNPALQNWMMTSNYYDPNYDMITHAKDPKFGADFFAKRIRPYLAHMLDSRDEPKPRYRGLFRMRPIGIQTGFGAPTADNSPTGESYLFRGSNTNQTEKRVNGPADNKISSCLGCHGAAGVDESLPGAAFPHFMNNADATNALNTGDHLDFSQQLQLARDFFETMNPK